MSIFFTVLKSMSWGFCLLILVIIGAISATDISTDLSKRLPNDTHKKVANLYAIIQPKLNNLQNAYSSSQPSNLYQQTNKIAVDIRKDIVSICGDCQLKSFFPSSSYDIISFRDYLEKRSQENATEENNSTYLIAATSSMLGTAFCIYLIAGLVRFRNNAKYALILVLVGIPIVLCLLAGSSLYMDETWFYTKFGGPNERNVNFLFFSTFYFFVGYPAIYAVAKKWNIPLKKVIKLTSS